MQGSELPSGEGARGGAAKQLPQESQVREPSEGGRKFPHLRGIG